MGDEMHQRNVACSSLLLRALAPGFARTVGDPTQLASALGFIAGNDQFFLNVAMAMGKSIMDPVRNIPASTVVTAMSPADRAVVADFLSQMTDALAHDDGPAHEHRAPRGHTD